MTLFTARFVRLVPAIATLGTALGTFACNTGDSTIAPRGDAHAILASATLFVHAINLATAAPYDTLRLSVSQQLADGTPAQAQVTYSVSDSTIVVDSAGLLRAKFPTASPAIVRVAVTLNGLTRHDSARVFVVDGQPSAFPRAVTIATDPDSLPRTIPGGAQSLTTTVRDVDGMAIGGTIFAVTSRDTTIAKLDPFGGINGVAPGHTLVSVETYAFDRMLTDSLPFVVTETANYTYIFTERQGDSTPVYSLGIDTARVTTGAVVTWANETSALLDIVFDDPTHVDSASIGIYDPPPPATGRGNIPAFRVDSTSFAEVQKGNFDFFYQEYTSSHYARAFPVAGTYRFHSELRHLHGTIIVCDGPCVP